MTNSLEDEIQRIVARMDELHNNQEQEPPDTTEQEKEPAETVHIHYFPDAIVILKEDENTAPQSDAIETTLAQTKKPPVFIAYTICSFYLFLIFSCIAFQVYEIVNPPIATVTIVPYTKTITTTTSINAVSGATGAGEIQARLLPTLTKSESAIINATGKGHQNASFSQGTITFYNGLLTSQTISAGIIFTGANGVAIITSQDAIIPAATPPIEGIATVTAHAVKTGSAGNIPAKAIDTPCCAPSVLAVNLASFQGGADARDYTFLTQSDIDSAIQSLKNHLTPQMQQNIQSQVQQGESLVTPTCSQTLHTDHTAGDETPTAIVKLTEQCYSVTYQSATLENQAAQIVTSIAQATLDSHYSLIGSLQVTIHHATMQDIKKGRAAILITITGTWVYALDKQTQEFIKKSIAGKTKQEALHLLASLPGIEHAAIAWSDDTKLPKNVQNMHLHILVQNF